MNKLCSVCNIEFYCSTSPGCKGCWCDSYPAIMPLDFSQGCRCPSCLQEAIQQRVNKVLAEKPIAEVVAMAQPFAGNKTLQEGIDYSVEQGNYVFSAWYHLKRGSCCGNGCRHCPYPKQNAP